MSRQAQLSRHENPIPPLEVIRRKEAEAKRQLAAESDAAQTALTEMEHRACELIAAAEAEGQRLGNLQRHEAQVKAECEAKAIITQAQAKADLLKRAGAEQMETAVEQAVAVVLGMHQ